MKRHYLSKGIRSHTCTLCMGKTCYPPGIPTLQTKVYTIPHYIQVMETIPQHLTETHYSFTFTFPKLLSIRQDTTQEARFTTQFTDHKLVEGTLTVPPSESQPGHPVATRLRSLPLTVVALTERVHRHQGPLFAIYSLSPHEVRTERTLNGSSLLLAVLGLP